MPEDTGTVRVDFSEDYDFGFLEMLSFAGGRALLVLKMFYALVGILTSSAT